MQLHARISKPKTKGSYGETYGPFSFLGKEVLYQWISLRWSMKRIESSHIGYPGTQDKEAIKSFQKEQREIEALIQKRLAAHNRRIGFCSE